MNIQIIAAFSIYFVLLIIISYIASLKVKSSSGFILGNRDTNFFVTAIALHASDMSHWLFLAFPAVVYASGLIRFWEILGIITFMFLNWHFIAPKIRKETEKYKALTLFEYFEKKFKDTNGIIRILTATISVFFFTFYITSGLIALGKLFESAFGLHYEIGAGVGLSIALIYTLIGGFVSVAWCDFFQGLFAFAMIIFVPAVALYTIGGFGPIISTAQAKGVSLSIIPSWEQIWPTMWLFLIWGPGYFGQPQLISFFMGIKHPKNIKYAKLLGLTWQSVTLGCSALMGLVGLAYFEHGDETIYIRLTKLLFCPFVAGIALCAIIAATLSTLDSYILTAGATVAQDIYKKITHKQASSKALLLSSRICSITISLIALIIACNKNITIYSLIKYAWAGMGSAFGPLVVATLYSKKTNKYGAIAGILTGSAVAAIFPSINPNIPELIPGFICSYIAIYIVSLLTRKHKITKNG